jgi:hypothetical protein
MLQFRKIDYSKMLYESLRAYFSVNSSGQLSILYKFLFSCLYPLQPAFNNYDTFRIKKKIIAGCKWQIGQLTNVLNYFFDPDSSRIYITQSTITILSAPVFEETTAIFAPVFEETTSVFAPVFSGLSARSNVTFWVPNSVNMSELISVIEQIKINGIPYQIQLL